MQCLLIETAYKLLHQEAWWALAARSTADILAVEICYFVASCSVGGPTRLYVSGLQLMFLVSNFVVGRVLVVI